MNIYQRINEVRKKVASVQKDATVQNYRAVTHDMVTAALHDAMVEQGIILSVNQTSAEKTEIGQTAKGGKVYRYSGWYLISLINAADPADRMTGNVNAEADDFGDKAPGKAMSYAVKAFLLKSFSLETGESDESRLEQDRFKDALVGNAVEQLETLLDANDLLGVYLLSDKVGKEAYIEVFNNPPAGTNKTTWKSKRRTAESTGVDVYQAILDAIADQDSLKAIENLDGASDSTKAMLAHKLGPKKSMELGALTKGEKE